MSTVSCFGYSISFQSHGDKWINGGLRRKLLAGALSVSSVLNVQACGLGCVHVVGGLGLALSILSVHPLLFPDSNYKNTVKCARRWSALFLPVICAISAVFHTMHVLMSSALRLLDLSFILIAAFCIFFRFGSMYSRFPFVLTKLQRYMACDKTVRLNERPPARSDRRQDGDKESMAMVVISASLLVCFARIIWGR